MGAAVYFADNTGPLTEARVDFRITCARLVSPSSVGNISLHRALIAPDSLHSRPSGAAGPEPVFLDVSCPVDLASGRGITTAPLDGVRVFLLQFTRTQGALAHGKWRAARRNRAWKARWAISYGRFRERGLDGRQQKPHRSPVKIDSRSIKKKRNHSIAC